MIKYRLTTSDNPYDPFESFPDWYAFDTRMGYHTTSYLSRILRTSYELSEQDQELENKRAIEEILSFNLTGKYKMVSRKTST